MDAIKQPQVLAAIIGATVAILTFIAKDIVVFIWQKSSKSKEDQQVVFRKYSDPLAQTAMSLLWRLNEIFYKEGQGPFLRANVSSSKYVEYKRLSTVYRLASLLGWIRAFRRELSFLRTRDPYQLKGIKESLNFLETTLADGTIIERKRVKGLMKIWEYDKDLIEKDLDKISLLVEHELKEYLYKSEVISATNLSEEKQFEICLTLNKVISSNLNMRQLSDDIIRETRARAVRHMSYVEAWLYRDWQDGIGDIMIKKSDSPSRSYEIIGFREFEEMCISGTNEQKRWLRRIAALIENLNISENNEYDARVEQLKSVAVAVARIVRSVSNNDSDMKIFLEKTLELADKIDPPRRHSQAS